MSVVPRVDARDVMALGLEAAAWDKSIVRYDGDGTVAEVDALSAARDVFRVAALEASYGNPGSQEALEEAEAHLERLEREARRREAAVVAAREKTLREAREAREVERLAAVEAQQKAQAELDALEPQLRATAKEFAKVAGQVMALGTQAAGGTGANQSRHVAAALKNALFDAVSDRPREWLFNELGGRPSGRDRGVA